MMFATEAQARAVAQARVAKSHRGRRGYRVYQHRFLPDTFIVVPRTHRITKRVWQLVVGFSPSEEPAMKCQIKWIDAAGQSTADDNEAIGRVQCGKRIEQHNGRAIAFTASAWFHICAEHAKRLNEPGMHIWTFEPFVCLADGTRMMVDKDGNRSIFDDVDA